MKPSKLTSNDPAFEKLYNDFTRKVIKEQIQVELRNRQAFSKPSTKKHRAEIQRKHKLKLKQRRFKKHH